jgi:hypothetical protein
MRYFIINMIFYKCFFYIVTKGFPMGKKTVEKLLFNRFFLSFWKNL